MAEWEITVLITMSIFKKKAKCAAGKNCSIFSKLPPTKVKITKDFLYSLCNSFPISIPDEPSVEANESIWLLLHLPAWTVR